MANRAAMVAQSRSRREKRLRIQRLEAKAFDRALRNWAATAIPEHVLEATQHLAMLGLRELVLNTPVDTGRARGGWIVSLTVPSDRVSNAKDGKGGGTVAKGDAKVQTAQPYQIIWMSNNTEYIRILDQGGFVPANPGPSKTGGSQSKRGRKARKGEVLVEGGYSIQAPAGMTPLAIRAMRSYKIT